MAWLSFLVLEGARVGHADGGDGPASVEFKFAGFRDEFAGSQGSHGEISADRVVKGDELGAVWKNCFDLNFLHQFRHSFHYLISAKPWRGSVFSFSRALAMGKPSLNSCRKEP